jgi:Na+/melibiose symporter-like transporter
VPPHRDGNRSTGGWLNRNILGLGLASLFSDMSHEMTTAVLPIFLTSVLGAPAFALGLIEGVAEGISTLFEIWSGRLVQRSDWAT